MKQYTHTRPTAWLMPLLACLLLASCAIEDDGPYGGDSLRGTWYNADDPSECYVLYGDGTGYWTSAGYSMDLDYDYSWSGGWIDFYFYPPDAPAYSLQCSLQQSGYNQICVTYPPGNGYGYTQVFYNRAN